MADAPYHVLFACRRCERSLSAPYSRCTFAHDTGIKIRETDVVEQHGRFRVQDDRHEQDNRQWYHEGNQLTDVRREPHDRAQHCIRGKDTYSPTHKHFPILAPRLPLHRKEHDVSDENHRRVVHAQSMRQQVDDNNERPESVAIVGEKLLFWVCLYWWTHSIPPLMTCMGTCVASSISAVPGTSLKSLS